MQFLDQIRWDQWKTMGGLSFNPRTAIGDQGAKSLHFKFWVCHASSAGPNIFFYKTGVINDPLGQPTVPGGSDCLLIVKFWDGRTYGHSVWKWLSLSAGTVVGLVNQYLIWHYMQNLTYLQETEIPNFKFNIKICILIWILVYTASPSITTTYLDKQATWSEICFHRCYRLVNLLIILSAFSYMISDRNIIFSRRDIIRRSTLWSLYY